MFELGADPDEFAGLGRDPGHEATRARLHRMRTERLIDRKNRVAMTDETVLSMREGESSSGIIIGVWEPPAEA